MPKVTFPSEWLKPKEDVRDGDQVKFLNVGEQKPGPNGKPTWEFKVAVIRNGLEIIQKKFTLNKKNADVVFKLYGDNSDNWVGKSLPVVVVNVDTPTGVKPAIRFVAPDDEVAEESIMDFDAV